MENLENPNSSKSFSKKGLVLGYIQSGKTANFTALIAKAADSGYRLVIVLAGVHNTLRSQTQKRLDQELTGEISEYIDEKDSVAPPDKDRFQWERGMNRAGFWRRT